MAIILEDGTIVTGANSFVSLEETDAYFDARVDTVWESAADEQKTRAIILASDYITQAWRLRWNGSLADGSQALTWPRRGVPVPDFFDPFYTQVGVLLSFQSTLFIPENEIPQAVKDAQMLLARSIMDDSGVASKTLQAPVGRQTSKEKAGSLEVQYMTPSEGGSAKQTTEYWDAMQRIAPFLNPAYGISGRLSRN